MDWYSIFKLVIDAMRALIEIAVKIADAIPK